MLSGRSEVIDGHRVLDWFGGKSFGDFVVVDEELLLLVYESKVEVRQSHQILVEHF